MSTERKNEMFIGSGEKQKSFRKAAAVLISKLKKNDRDENKKLIPENQPERITLKYMEEEEKECSHYQQILNERK